MNKATFTEVAVDCVDTKYVENNDRNLGGAKSFLKMASAGWIGTSWVHGELDWGRGNQQFNTFG